MDPSAIERFHGTVEPLTMEGFTVPIGGLSGFLHDNLCFKVFLVSIAVFDDRWATRARDTLRAQELHEICVCVRIIIDHVATWMFYIISVLLRIVRFDRDDDPNIHGVSIFALASAQVDFFIKECAETVSIFHHSKDPVFLDYKDYDPCHTVETIFPSRRVLHQYKKVRVDNNPVIDFDLMPNKLYWTDAQRVVEATLIALSRVDGPIIVETGDDGSVVGVQKESVEGLLADMGDVEKRVPETLALLSAGYDIMGNIMQFVIRPSVYLLDCALRPANRHYLQCHELTMLELVFVHDVFAQFHLLENGGVFPTEDQVIHGVSPADAPFLGFVEISINLNRAVILGRGWNLIEPLDNFPAYLAPNTDEIIMGIESA
ncbi:hypothetical protein B0H16DRAFT_1740180 [Mycena metata]|uniref:Uncharacterized protein n=1 Tax=Mycena metata TaxID=1033252 RepID=A0AAD7HDZ0_9AGAR|nr:hypothetical protein B0H16DRAFT_1740180 [Mycena metata]